MRSLTNCSATSSNCCTGQYGSPEACPPSDIPFYDYFSTSTSTFLIQGTFAELSTFREQLSGRFRLSSRRCFADLRGAAKQQLYHHFLPTVNNVRMRILICIYTGRLMRRTNVTGITFCLIHRVTTCVLVYPALKFRSISLSRSLIHLQPQSRLHFTTITRRIGFSIRWPRRRVTDPLSLPSLRGQ